MSRVYITDVNNYQGEDVLTYAFSVGVNKGRDRYTVKKDLLNRRGNRKR